MRNDSEKKYLAEVKRFRESLAALEKATAARFPKGCRVKITFDSGTEIVGEVFAQVAMCPDRIAVLLENGNVWDYQVEMVKPCN